MSHAPSGFRILASSDNGYIGMCSCCQRFNFVYKNLLLTFSEEEVLRFVEWLIESKSNPENLTSLPHGRDRIYCSPLSNLYLVFNQEELDDIAAMFAETKLLLEATRIIAGR